MFIDTDTLDIMQLYGIETQPKRLINLTYLPRGCFKIAMEMSTDCLHRRVMCNQPPPIRVEYPNSIHGSTEEDPIIINIDY